MGKIIGLLVVLLSLVLPVSGCTAGTGRPNVEQTVWILESFADESVQVTSYGLTVPSATLSDGLVWGVLGANSFSGKYELSGDDISFSQLTSAEIAEDSEAAEQETLFLLALQAAAHVKVQDQMLLILDSTDTVLMRFSEALEG